MDFTTLIGVFCVVVGIGVGFATGGIPRVFINPHGIGLVCGGTLCAMLINTPWNYLRGAFAALGDMWSGERYPPLPDVIVTMVALATQVQQRGVAAFAGVDGTAVNGYLKHAVSTAQEYNDAVYVGSILENEIDQVYDHQNELVNVYRTMGVLAPMFGLLGTLIGIVEVLREIASPDQVAKAMGIAVTTAFYGIMLANVFCIPVAGKLRIRYWQEMRAKTIVREAVIMMLKGSTPLVIERRLKSFLEADHETK
jgi:chemotaxis protein MotA